MVTLSKLSLFGMSALVVEEEFHHQFTYQFLMTEFFSLITLQLLNKK